MTGAADDDWTIKYKIDTKAIDAALEKVEALRKAMDGIHGVGGRASPTGRTGGRRPANQEHDAHLNAMRRQEAKERKEALRHVAALREDAARERRKQIDHGRALAEQAARERRRELDHGRALDQQANRRNQRLMNSHRALNHNERLRANYERQQRRAGLTESQAHAENARRDRRAGLTESQAHAENARRDAAARQRRMQGSQDSLRAAQHNERLRSNYERELARQGNREYRLETARGGSMDRLQAANDRRRAAGLGSHADVRNFQQRLAGASSFQEISRINSEMRRFIRESNAAAAAQERITREMQRQGFAARSMQRSMANFARSYLSIFAVIGGANSIYRNAKEMENLQIKMLMGMGSKGEAAKTNSYIQEFSQRTGTSIKSNTNLYAQLGITAKDAGMGDAQIKKVFEDTTTMAMGYGLGPDQQKLVTKAIVQMMSKQSVQAEEFKNQLGDQAPGVMALLQKAVGLEEGKEGSKKLVAMMKKGQIGIDSLFKFLDIVSKRAKETGAYDLSINSMTASQNRMNNAFEIFSSKFMTFFDEDLKSTFSFVQGVLDDMSTTFAKIDEANSKGVFGAGSDTWDVFVESLRSLLNMFDTAIEGLWELISLIVPGAGGKSMKDFVADREMERAYFKEKGATTQMDKIALQAKGMPGYTDFVKESALRLGGSPEVAAQVAMAYANRNVTSVLGADSGAAISQGSMLAQSQMAWMGNIGKFLFGSGVAKPTQTTVSPTFYFTVKNNEEAQDLVKQVTDQLLGDLKVPFR